MVYFTAKDTFDCIEPNAPNVHVLSRIHERITNGSYMRERRNARIDICDVYSTWNFA